jgi:hypothetical protein
MPPALIKNQIRRRKENRLTGRKKKKKRKRRLPTAAEFCTEFNFPPAEVTLIYSERFLEENKATESKNRRKHKSLYWLEVT